MKTMRILLTAVLCSTALCAQNIYESVETIAFDPGGYFATEQSLDKLFNDQEIKTVIELGSWAGASTRFLARRVGEGGLVYAIDHWQGSQNHRGEMTDPRLQHIYHLFLSNIKDAGVADRVIPLRMSSEEAARALRPDIRADLIYVDTARDTDQVYGDIMNWHPFLNEKGVLCGTEWREPAVRTAVQRAASELGKTIESDRKGFFWALR
ncbi:MAG: class I SAM-dependent methyltransferase [Simkaniaceae bacterium]|nr:class I SAM-dependent methyltransferase [Candidatus Sacchlamyda saccharinae]